MQPASAISDGPERGQRRGFFAWWIEELGGLLPKRSSQFARPKRRTVAAIAPSGVRWLDETDQSLKLAGPETGNLEAEPGTLKTIQRMLSRRRPVPFGIRLQRSACFERRVELPSAAKADFARILELDLERATPFKHKDVYTAFCEDLGAPGAKGKTALRQVIVKRELVDGPRQRLAAQGLDVSFADCWDESGLKPLPLDFLAKPPSTASESPPPRTLAKLLMLSALALAASAAWLTIERGNAALADLDKQVAAAKSKAQTIRKTIGDAEAAFKDAAALQTLKSGIVPATQVMEEVSRLLPDTTYVTDFRIGNGKVSITGLSQSAAALVPLIEQSELFEGAVSAAPVLLDPASGKEQFKIEARFRPAAQSGPAQSEPAP